MMATKQPDWKEVGYIGDKNWPEYSGGPVFVDQTGVYPPELEYIESPESDEPGAEWTVYRVVLDQEVPDWGDVKAVAQSTGQPAKEIRNGFIDDDPIQRALAYQAWAGYYGWENFDNYPLTLSILEVEKRYDTDLGGRSAIVSALKETIERMADESSATAWSGVGDQLESDLEDEGFDPEHIVSIGEFGDAMAVNGDILVDRGWEESLGLKPGKHPRLWNDVGTHKLEGWLEDNGYELTDKGGRIPAEEGYAYGEHVIDAVAKELKLPTEDVAEVAKTLDYWQEEIPDTSGDGSVWAKKKAKGAEERRGTRRR